jgi:hypothetical protein
MRINTTKTVPRENGRELSRGLAPVGKRTAVSLQGMPTTLAGVCRGPADTEKDHLGKITESLNWLSNSARVTPSM